MVPILSATGLSSGLVDEGQHGCWVMFFLISQRWILKVGRICDRFFEDYAV